MARKTICTDLKAVNMQGRDTACDTCCETDLRMVRAPAFNKVANPASPQFNIAPTTARIRGTSYRLFSVPCSVVCNMGVGGWGGVTALCELGR